MNVKGGSSVLVGLIVVLGDNAIHYFFDSSKDKDALLAHTSTTLVEVNTRVIDLTEQVKRLLEQPYVGRSEFEGRLSGLEERVSHLERTQQPDFGIQNHRKR
jgi:hypothetical protein